MSRGPGTLQRLILGNLGQEPLQLNELCWRLAESEGRITDKSRGSRALPDGEMDKSFYSSFHRAVELLDGKIVRARRKLETVDELCASIRSRRAACK